MFTTLHDGKIYLDDIALTYLMADSVKESVEETEEWILNSFDGPGPDLCEKLSNQIVDNFKQNWRRPRDGSNKDATDMYRSVPEAVQYATSRHLAELRAAAARRSEIEGYRRLLDEILDEGERG